MSGFVHLSTLEREHTYTQKAFDDAEAFLATCKDTFHVTANYGQFKEGLLPYTVRGAACHAGMGSLSKAVGYDLIATEVYLDPKNRDDSRKHRRMDELGRWQFYNRDPKVVENFFNWFVYESEFGRFILNRDRESVKTGWIFSTDLPASITQALCIVGRHFYEVLDCSFETFDKLVSKGVSKPVAFVTAFNSYWGYYGVYPRKPDDIFIPLYNHRMFSFPSDISMLKNFNKGLVNPKLLKGSYRSHPTVNGTSELFGGYGTETVPFTYGLLGGRDKDLLAFVRELRGDKDVGVKVVNPFVRENPKTNPKNVTYDEMFKIIVYLTQRGDFN